MRAHRKRYPKGTWMRLRSGSLLRELMNTKGVSNADVGIAAGVGRTFISALVNNRRNSCTEEVALRIARRLEVPFELLFDPTPSAGSGRSDNKKVAV